MANALQSKNMFQTGETKDTCEEMLVHLTNQMRFMEQKLTTKVETEIAMGFSLLETNIIQAKSRLSRIK